MNLILVRRDDPEQTVTLVKSQDWRHGRSGFCGIWRLTQSMINDHRTPCMFPDSLWEIAREECG